MTGTASLDAPAAAPSAVYRRVVDIIAMHTLYDTAHLQPDSHLEGELGIDSVVLESILAEVREQFGLADGAAAPRGPATIRELADAVELAVDAGALNAPAPVSRPGADEVLDAVLTAAVAHTHYPRHRLDPEADLEGDLGIDSVVLAAIAADARRALDLPQSAAVALTARTLRELADQLTGTRPAGAPSPAPARRPEPARVPEAGSEYEYEYENAHRTEYGSGYRPAARPETSPEHRTEPRPERAPQPAALPGAVGGPWDPRSMKDFVEQRDPDLFAKARSFGAYRRQREREQLYWYGMPLQSRCQNRAVIHDELTGRTREYLMFASNNYLGLANHPHVIDAICDATRVYGATNTGCRLIGGTNVLHKELERRLAAFKQREACIVFPGGYSANLGTIAALVKNYDTLAVDKLNHMSIVDGGRLAGAARRIYQHNDMADLERVLERGQGQGTGTLIVTDGVFSMHGDICELPGIVRLAKRYGARVLVDDAHATGVLGARGTGTAEHFDLKGQVDLELGTMSKTLAGMGGFVVGDEDVIEYLRYYADSYVFAATIPAGVAAGLIAAIDVIEAEPERIRTLWSNIRLLRGRLLQAGFDLEHSDSAILPIVVGDERAAMELGRAVRARGLFCQTVVFPGVPLGQARLRVSVTSEHTEQDLNQAADIFVDAACETGVLPAQRQSRAALR
ncbi:aminotransferase class I/II-fold pyridoxal phosphate-dependent enzyme [Actinocrinis puniceicyclus]|uniref:8-amino-7-oxononanoate synthase n=1 Tax=Actinocrinis puniceicyclus TaxID=977794 RepID=A0A8J7WQL8_9ACTN|nr:aminotransferase class I/II-fold pyridoxal phosphate-dependent enzyme [Actinocrinis puniceicyclus]MBS2963705.1 aminotransferase class I/II-fold pyridoxal phosphate-dependent enzyme [Actinocrinis puniceicyclus]